MFVDNPNHKGNVAELAIATEAARLGLSVLKPLTEHERYDLVLGIGGRLLRVQCKWARKKGDVISVSLSTSRRGPDGYVRGHYSSADVDAIGAYCEELRSCFLIPIEAVADQWAVQLRLAPARNGQRAALHFADQYRLGAVAQLAERRRGTAEARGSNPLSSTLRDADTAPTTEEVGAHKFRNHFGYYMERAAAGTEILIRRRGKPYARLGPARSQD
jgi:prevent-host-death family protein